MKKPSLFAIALLIMVTVQPAPLPSARIFAAQAEQTSPPHGIEGVWEGVLDVGAAKLRLVLKISKEKDATFAATVDSPDQGAVDLPVSSITLEGAALRFEMKMIGGLYEGTLNKDRSEVSGTWKQGDNSWPLSLKWVDQKPETTTKPQEPKKPETAAKPQEPKKPYPYDEEDVSYENKAGGVKLAGTLTLPRTKGPFPAVVLITGSGPQNRNEELLGHKPFLVLPTT